MKNKLKPEQLTALKKIVEIKKKTIEDKKIVKK